MKAQRRHELKENELSKVIKGAPTFWQQSGGRLLALLVAVLVIALLINFRVKSNREGRAAAVQGLSQARALIEEMRAMPMRDVQAMAFGGPGTPPETSSLRRKQYFNEANTLLGEVTRLTDDESLTAEALLARGDLNWTYAMLPEIPGAATQPAMQVNSKELIDTAAEAYRSALDSYPENERTAIPARFGLAAIAEQRGEWETARKLYEEITAQTNEQSAYEQLATERLRILEQLQHPVILATPATQPALPPLIAAPTTGATTQAAGTTTQGIAAAATNRVAGAPTTAPAIPAPVTTAPTATAPATQPR